LLVMNPESAEALEKKQLPMFLYELHSLQEEKRFVKINYSLATSDSERVAVDHVYKSVDQGSKESIMAQNLTATMNAVKLLRARVQFLIKIVKEKPELREDQDFMRKLKSIVAQVPINRKGEFDHANLTDYSDIATANTMAAMTKGLQLINQMTESLKFN
jgi:hypothetical protein